MFVENSRMKVPIHCPWTEVVRVGRVSVATVTGHAKSCFVWLPKLGFWFLMSGDQNGWVLHSGMSCWNTWRSDAVTDPSCSPANCRCHHGTTKSVRRHLVMPLLTGSSRTHNGWSLMVNPSRSPDRNYQSLNEELTNEQCPTVSQGQRSGGNLLTESYPQEFLIARICYLFFWLKFVNWESVALNFLEED